MNKNILATLSLAAMTFSTLPGVSLAADAPVLKPVVTSGVVDAGHDWSGLYLGGQVSGVVGTSSVDDLYSLKFDDHPFRSEPDLTGWAIGGHIGYNLDLGGVVIGAQSDLNWASYGGDEYYRPIFPDDSGELSDREYAKLDFNADASSVVKIGLPVGNFLPFLTAGLSVAQADVTRHREWCDDTCDDPTPTYEVHDFTSSLLMAGPTVGLGASVAISDDMILTGEVRHTVYGDVQNSACDSSTCENALISASTTRASVGLSIAIR